MSVCNPEDCETCNDKPCQGPLYELVEPEENEYRTQSGLVYVISGGIGGRSWGTYVRKPNGSLRRKVSPFLPIRETREQALEDFRNWIMKQWRSRRYREWFDVQPIVKQLMDEQAAQRRQQNHRGGVD